MASDPNEREESFFVAHEPCPRCGSRDNLSRYSDGHGYCHGCKYYEHADGDARKGRTEERLATTRARGLIAEVQYRDLKSRGISAATCRNFDYGVAKDRAGNPLHVAQYRDVDGDVVAQKVRGRDKQFYWLGKRSAATKLFGQHRYASGKMLVITEGEIDALSVAEVQDSKWPVVSVTDGASGAVKCIQANLDWVEQFETVVFMFDMDEPGQTAAKECAELLSPGKAKIAVLPLKDANEMLLDGKGAEIVNAIWRAPVYRPDGIICGTDLWEVISTEPEGAAVEYPWPCLNAKVRGIRRGEIVTFTAGTGIGKSQITREIAHHLIQKGESVGIIALEENVRQTALGLMSLQLNSRLHLEPLSKWNQDLLREAYASTVGCGRVYLYDHWGSLEAKRLLSRIRAMARQCGVGWVILDHVSIAVSGLESGNERKDIDVLMTNLRSLAEETRIGLLVVSHLRRPEGKGHEDGAQTSLSQLRGSASIGQVSDIVIGLERDQQAGEGSHITTVRVLKNRWVGDSGVAGYLAFDQETGRLREVEKPDQPGDDEGGDEADAAFKEDAADADL